MTTVIDILILSLLAATVVYAFFVERRVRALMQALHEMHPTVMAFSHAVDRTENSVAALRSSAQETLAASDARRQDEPFKTRRQKPPSEALRIAVKAELIKGFFESARKLKT